MSNASLLSIKNRAGDVIIEGNGSPAELVTLAINRGLSLVKADLSDFILSEVDFRGLDLSGVYFSRTTLDGAVFDHAYMGGADFNKAVGCGTSFIDVECEFTNFSNCAFTSAHFDLFRCKRSKFAIACFKRTSMHNALFSACDFGSAELRCIDLTRATFSHCNFSDAVIDSFSYGKDRTLVTTCCDINRDTLLGTRNVAIIQFLLDRLSGTNAEMYAVIYKLFDCDSYEKLCELVDGMPDSLYVKVVKEALKRHILSNSEACNCCNSCLKRAVGI